MAERSTSTKASFRYQKFTGVMGKEKTILMSDGDGIVSGVELAPTRYKMRQEHTLNTIDCSDDSSRKCDKVYDYLAS